VNRSLREPPLERLPIIIEALMSSAHEPWPGRKSSHTLSKVYYDLVLGQVDPQRDARGFVHLLLQCDFLVLLALTGLAPAPPRS
jgi:hypothetical protein